MARWSFRILFLLLLVATVGLALHSRDLAAMCGRGEREVHRLTAELAAARQQVSPPAASSAAAAPTPSPEPEVELTQYARLELELHEARHQLAAVSALLEQRNEELLRRAELAQERAARALRPIPEGVRLCLDQLHTCLRAEGFHDQRFLGALQLDDDGLHDVELLETASDGLGVAFVAAARMTATLERATGTLVLRFFDGVRAENDDRKALPEDGYAVTFRGVDGRMFEQRLPYLVHGEGTYPAPADPAARTPGELDPVQRRQWLSRLDLLLSAAKLSQRWRAAHVRGLQDAQFQQLQLVGSDPKGLLTSAASAQRAEVEVDRRAGVVSLRLYDGVLHLDGVESSITGEGFRMVLPGVTPETAIDAMMGMVVNK
ncbi:MAG: hypothetical protein H6835_05560 [Planctomycetes bacterium]|nr:hypothetical protein [Planctomycetota bacterium]